MVIYCVSYLVSSRDFPSRDKTGETVSCLVPSCDQPSRSRLDLVTFVSLPALPCSKTKHTWSEYLSGGLDSLLFLFFSPRPPPPHSSLSSPLLLFPIPGARPEVSPSSPPPPPSSKIRAALVASTPGGEILGFLPLFFLKHPKYFTYGRFLVKERVGERNSARKKVLKKIQMLGSLLKSFVGDPGPLATKIS